MTDTRRTYEATATRTDRFWLVEVEGLPRGAFNRTQGRSWAEAEEMAGDLVALLLDVPEDSFDVRMTPGDEASRDALAALALARAAAREAERAEADALRHAARTLTQRGFSVRDAGAALGISYQRVSQLAPRQAA